MKKTYLIKILPKLIFDLKDYVPNQSVLDLDQTLRYRDGMYLAELYMQFAIIQGPKHRPFSRGFRILSTGDIIYVPEIKQWTNWKVLKAHVSSSLSQS